MGPSFGIKCLTEIAGRPLIEHIVTHLKNQGASTPTICVGWGADGVQIAIGGLDVKTHDAGIDASMTDRVIGASDDIKEFALVCYGDEWANVNLHKLIRVHEWLKRDMTTTIVPLRSEFGLFHAYKVQHFDDLTSQLIQRRHIRFEEKPILSDYWVNIGYTLFHKRTIQEIWNGESWSDILKCALEANRLAFYRHLGKRWTINTPEDIPRAEEECYEK